MHGFSIALWGMEAELSLSDRVLACHSYLLAANVKQLVLIGTKLVVE